MLIDVDIQIQWMLPLKLWALATDEIDAGLPDSSVTERFYEDAIESRCIEMELHSFGCIDARLP